MKVAKTAGNESHGLKPDGKKNPVTHIMQSFTQENWAQWQKKKKKKKLKSSKWQKLKSVPTTRKQTKQKFCCKCTCERADANENNFS